MKTYVITLSKVFPATHPCKGEPTDFREAFQKTKLHTIRANYPLWAKRIAEVQRGEAVLSVRQWSGRPYMSKQETIATLTADDGVGIQRLSTYGHRGKKPVPIIEGWYMDGNWGSYDMIATNDGLSLEDWKDWFRHYDKSKPLAIIHFTKFRY